jgi:hypothetical protein
VWCWYPSFDDLHFAAELGVRRLDVMVNDFSAKRSPTRFRMNGTTDGYRNLVAYATAAGIPEVHFTSWVMPHVPFCREAGDELQQLCIDTGAYGVVFDAEEPWTLATQRDYEGAAEELRLALKGCRVGITGIGYASRDKLSPLMRIADYGIPQAYSTTTSNVAPGRLPRIIEHWKWWGKPLVPGLAAYRTGGAQAMRQSFDAVQPADAVIYWNLRHLRTTKTSQRVIRELAGKAEKDAAE